MKPRLLDLFCGAGGAARGYQRAGFYVVGVDNRPQPRYAGDEFIQAGALEFPLDGFDAIHASPPCQAHSAGRAMPRAATHKDLVESARTHLVDSGLPYVIENVVGAPLRDPVMLCGTSLGLGADGHDLARHRLFETSWPMPMLSTPACRCGRRPVIGVYGQRAKTSRGATLTIRTSRWGRPQSLSVGGAAMGVDWMTWDELAQAIPPAYTEHIGGYLMAELAARRVVARA